MELLFPPLSDLMLIAPELVLTIGICLVLVADLFVPKPRKSLLGVLSLIVVLATLLASFPLLRTRGEAFAGMMLLDGYAMFFKVVFLLVTGLTILISLRYIAVEDINLGEYYGLLLFATLGMMIMAAGGDLISIYLGL
ncbi:MAG: NADH-quinone oxidoreductase subunit L, partial [Candidatus Tectomicrobia bacterium]|nr:NADH-quinone oxidoreductase subunit L [Candidatus Tectomicrobia bacterium]